MSSCLPEPSTDEMTLNAALGDGNVFRKNGSSLTHENEGEDDEDDEGDLDFNPFLNDAPSVEASSSLSSEIEIEGLDVEMVDSARNISISLAATLLSKEPDKAQDSDVGDIVTGEEIATWKRRAGKTSLEEPLPIECEKRNVDVIYESEIPNSREMADASRTDRDHDVPTLDYGICMPSKKCIMDLNDDDAICMRTRARFSLASFTLDQLETFLQETDDEDDLQNVDDEEEYRKFLTAVLQGRDGNSGRAQENEGVDEEDEENDADFELEIEEALWSDDDENMDGETQGGEHKAAVRRPETRSNKRQKASLRHKRKYSSRPDRPLCHILPYTPLPPLHAFGSQNLTFTSTPHCVPSERNVTLGVFRPHQIGQLYCLIHEHVQLLVQVFSLCVLEPTRQHISDQAKGLLSEMLHRRDQLLASRKEPYSNFYFRPPQVQSSGNGELPTMLTTQSTSGCSAFDANSLVEDGHQNIPVGETSHAEAMQGCWVPFLNGPVLSVVDVAPLNLVGSYMNDVSTAVRECQRRHLTVSCDGRYEKECLFPYHCISPTSNVPPSSEQMHKRTTAAALVERAKNQSILVPKEIAKLAQRFFPLFNPALFPHKPAPAAVVNRVLFTDAEDMLLASGLMEFNTDWKRIRDNFLPCKSKHQIFIRQKNRSCSRAPENPIKAVRRMKNSALTAEEKARIDEGLKVYKLDWMSVWRFAVPYRDPSLLPRQWRTVVGTQKSYKGDENKNAKRRLYEWKKRNSRAVGFARGQISSDKEDCITTNAVGENHTGDDCVDNEDEAYLHEGFLADWRPGTSTITSEFYNSICGSSSSIKSIFQEGYCISEQIKKSYPLDSKLQSGKDSQAASLMFTQRPHNLPCSTHSSITAIPNQLNWPSSPPYRARGFQSRCLVKLAPDLPPVNLPPSVRVMSQSAFNKYHEEVSKKVSGPDDGFRGPSKEVMITESACAANSVTTYPTENGHDKKSPVNFGSIRFYPKSSSVSNNNSSGLQMHPLLFQASESGHTPYYPIPRPRPLLNLRLHNSLQAKNTIGFLNNTMKSGEFRSSSFGIEFHPLLQRTDDANRDSISTHSGVDSSPELPRGTGVQPQDPTDVIRTEIQDCSLSNPNLRINDLDLNLPLSCTGRKESGKSNDVDEKNMAKSVVSALEIYGVRTVDCSINQRKDCLPAFGILDGITSNLGSGANPSAVSSEGWNVNNIGDQSFPEIVMEQEELSDSEEEMGENVEFECEEMADSEGEGGSDSEQTTNLHNKDSPCVPAENIVLHESKCDQPKHNVSKGKCNPSSGAVRLDSNEQDNPSGSFCMNLNSSSPQVRKPKCAPNRKQKKGSHIVTVAESTTQEESPCDSIIEAAKRKSRTRAKNADSR